MLILAGNVDAVQSETCFLEMQPARHLISVAKKNMRVFFGHAWLALLIVICAAAIVILRAEGLLSTQLNLGAVNDRVI